MFRKSDLVLQKPPDTLAPKVFKMRSLLPFIHFWVDNVFPGQPITVRWRFNLGPSAGVNSVRVRFLIEGNLVLERPDIPTTAVHEGTGDQITTIVLTDPVFAGQIYRCHPDQTQTNPRRIELEVILGNGDVYRARRNFSVSRERPDGSWWQWIRTPTHERLEWNKPYLLAGEFRNNAHAKLSVLWLQLLEIRWQDNEHLGADLFATPPNPCYTDSEIIKEEERRGIAAGSTTPASFPRKQDWKWIEDGTYIAHGPFSKMFVSAVAFWFSDEYGNNYEWYCSSSVQRLIEVSDIKRAAGITATTAAATAAIWVAAAAAAAAGIFTAVLIPGFAAAAAGFYAAAVAAGFKAKDPPEPDPQFRDPVAITPLPLPDWPEDSEQLRITPLRKLIETAVEIIALDNARTVVRGRMMGARMFNDAAALARQRERYLEIEREMVAAAGRLDHILPDAQAAVEAVDALDPAKFPTWYFRMAGWGMASAVYDQLLRLRVSAEQANELIILPRDRTLADLANTNGVFLVPTVTALKAMVRAAEAEREMVLAGEETCIHPPPRDPDIDSDVPKQVRRAIRPPGCGCC